MTLNLMRAHKGKKNPPTILITGFGPFPGAPVNPTKGLVKTLAHAHRLRARIVPHVFHTSYAAVDRELPALLRRYRPDALLMFGLAAETPHLRIETWARNVLSALPDAAGAIAAATQIAPGRPGRQALTTPARAFLAAARRARVHAAISADAGAYLCNYLCWRVSLAVRKPGGPRQAAFIHVPEGMPQADLARASRAFLAAFARHV
jgi:pyroglutamyl-peptidase